MHRVAVLPMVLVLSLLLAVVVPMPVLVVLLLAPLLLRMALLLGGLAGQLPVLLITVAQSLRLEVTRVRCA